MQLFMIEYPKLGAKFRVSLVDNEAGPLAIARLVYDMPLNTLERERFISLMLVCAVYPHERETVLIEPTVAALEAELYQWLREMIACDVCSDGEITDFAMHLVRGVWATLAEDPRLLALIAADYPEAVSTRA